MFRNIIKSKFMPSIVVESTELTQSKLLPHMNELQDAVKRVMDEDNE